MFISIPKDFFISTCNTINYEEIINCKEIPQCESLNNIRDFKVDEFKKIFSNKFNFLIFKSLNIIKHIDLDHLYENMNMVFEILFYAHEVVLLSFNVLENNSKSIPNLSKLLCKDLEHFQAPKKNKHSKINTKEKSKKKKEKPVMNFMSTELKKSLDHIKFEQKSLIVTSLELIKNLNEDEKKELFSYFIENSLIPSIKYICNFMNINRVSVENDIRELLL